MTNEEIEAKALEVYDNIGPDFGATIAAGMRELVLRAYEEAAQRMCVECEVKNKPIHQNGLWMHPYASVCPAGDIHDLKESLGEQQS